MLLRIHMSEAAQYGQRRRDKVVKTNDTRFNVDSCTVSFFLIFLPLFDVETFTLSFPRAHQFNDTRGIAKVRTKKLSCVGCLEKDIFRSYSLCVSVSH